MAEAAAGAAPEVITFGECLASLVSSEPGPFAEVTSFRRYVAGSEANVAAGLARLGHRVTFLGCVGDDGFGADIVRKLRGEGVDVDRLRVVESWRTGVMFRERRGAGPSEIIYHRSGSAGSTFGPADVTEAVDGGLFAGARRLHITGITPALSAMARAAVLVALDAAQAAGLEISLDINLRRRLWTDADAALGNACGASVAAAEGDLTGAPTRAEAERLSAQTAEQSIR